MQLQNKEYILDLVDHVNNLTHKKYNVQKLKPIGDPSFKNETLDSPYKYYLPGIKPENDAVLMVSREAFPDFIERAVNNSRKAHALLSDQLSSVVLEPANDGRYRDLSYAIWPEHRPISDSRLIRKLQKKWLDPKVFTWLNGIAKDSMNQNIDEKSVDQFISTPLECIATNPQLSDNIHSYATKALQHLNTKKWTPITILQHSDFWLGNILFLKKTTRSSANNFGFCVIDWGGAQTHGAPVFDLVRYCISTHVSISRAREEFLRYAKTIQIEPRELIYHLICALGQIGMNLEQFPENRYLEMCEGNVSFIQTLGLEV